MTKRHPDIVKARMYLANCKYIPRFKLNLEFLTSRLKTFLPGNYSIVVINRERLDLEFESDSARLLFMLKYGTDSLR